MELVFLLSGLVDDKRISGRTPGHASRSRGGWSLPVAAPAVGKAGGPRYAPPVGAGT